MVFGSAFPDTGYAVSHAYGEVTHWTPFLSAFIDRLNHTETVDTLTKCFAVGMALHGLQDEIFDTFFLEQVAHFDGASQDIVDPGLDAIMVVDGIAQAKPEIFLPTDELVDVLASSFGVEVDASVIEEGRGGSSWLLSIILNQLLKIMHGNIAHPCPGRRQIISSQKSLGA